MQSTGELRAGAAPESHRRAVLLLVLLGFLTMHGFFASTSPADASTSGRSAATASSHGLGKSSLLIDPAAEGAAGHSSVMPAGAVTDAGATPKAGGDAEHEPAGHSNLMAGCVLALVGIVGLALTVVMLRRRGAPLARGLFRHVQLLTESLPTMPTPASAPYRLCVMRV